MDLGIRSFNLFTDPEWMKVHLQEQLPLFAENRLMITDLNVGYTAYKTYRNPASAGRSTLSVCYHLQVRDAVTQESGEQILYARACLENRSQAVFEKAKNSPCVTPRFGASIAHLSELDMVVWGFPNDPVLAHLPQCIDPEKVSGHFPYANLPSGLNRPEALQKVDIEIIHYRPEVRCTSRYALKWGRDSESKEVVLFGKTFKDDQGKALYERSLALFQETQGKADHFLIAEPLGYDASLKILWQSGLEGQSLVDVLDKTNFQPLLRSVAKGLARFHQSALVSPVRVKISEQVSELQKKTAKLIRAFPQFEDRLQEIAQHFEKDAAKWTPPRQTLIHADFSVQQLLVCGEKMACFDFDEFAMGDAAQDVANFIVDCHFRAWDRVVVPLMIAAFVHAYEEAAGLEIPKDRLNGYIQMLFVTKAYRFYLQQRPQLEKEIETILALARRGIAFEPGSKS